MGVVITVVWEGETQAKIAVKFLDFLLVLKHIWEDSWLYGVEGSDLGWWPLPPPYIDISFSKDAPEDDHYSLNKQRNWDNIKLGGDSGVPMFKKLVSYIFLAPFTFSNTLFR